MRLTTWTLLAGFSLSVGATVLSCSSDDSGTGKKGGNGGSASGGTGLGSGGAGGRSGGSGGSSSSGGSGGSSSSGGSGGSSSSGGSGGSSSSGGSGGSSSSGGSGGATAGSGGATAGAGGATAGADGGTAQNCPGNPAAYTNGFETDDSPKWAPLPGNDRISLAAPTFSTDQKHGGNRSLAFPVAYSKADAGPQSAFFIGLPNPEAYLQPGRTIKLWVYIPPDAKLGYHVFVINAPATGSANLPEGMGKNGWWPGTSGFGSGGGGWKEFSVTIPDTFNCGPLSQPGFVEVGLYAQLADEWTGTIYIDDASITAKP